MQLLGFGRSRQILIPESRLKGESMTHPQSCRIKERKDPEKSQMCHIHLSIIQLQVSEQLFGEKNLSSLLQHVSEHL